MSRSCWSTCSLGFMLHVPWLQQALRSGPECLPPTIHACVLCPSFSHGSVAIALRALYIGIEVTWTDLRRSGRFGCTHLAFLTALTSTVRFCHNTDSS